MMTIAGVFATNALPFLRAPYFLGQCQPNPESIRSTPPLTIPVSFSLVASILSSLHPPTTLITHLSLVPLVLQPVNGPDFSRSAAQV